MFPWCLGLGCGSTYFSILLDHLQKTGSSSPVTLRPTRVQMSYEKDSTPKFISKRRYTNSPSLDLTFWLPLGGINIHKRCSAAASHPSPLQRAFHHPQWLETEDNIALLSGQRSPAKHLRQSTRQLTCSSTLRHRGTVMLSRETNLL